MILSEDDIQRALIQAQTAFPHLTEWEYNNERNDDFDGFALWGEYTSPSEPAEMPTTFFITFAYSERNWRGSFTVGKPSYFWSSADVGDANLRDTAPCENLPIAIDALKTEVRTLFEALSVIE